MAKQHVEIGDSGTVAKDKINANADELYQKVEELGNQADTKVKVSATDDEASYLANKILTPNKTLSIGTAGAGGAAQTLQVDVHVSILARLVKMWDRTLNYKGTAYPGKATPQAPSNKDCYLVLESGVCFGVTGCTGGDFLYYSTSPAGWNKVTPNSDISAATAKVMAMWNEGFVFKGVALPTFNPGVPTAPVFYFNNLDSAARLYTYFGNEAVAANEFCVFKYDIAQDEWIKQTLFILPSATTNLNNYMRKDANLSDLVNKQIARVNLGVFSTEQVDEIAQDIYLEVSNESLMRQAADQALATALATEAQNRINTDNSLQEQISNLGAPVINVEYADLVSMIENGYLKEGRFYRIVDFKTIHYYFDDNQTIDEINDSCPIEQLMVLALNSTTLSKLAFSPDFPNDIIHYDWNPLNFRADKGFALNITAQDDTLVYGEIIPGFKGAITFRHDTVNNVSAHFDFRNVLFRRWNLETLEVWDDSQNTLYAIDQIVQYNGRVFKSLVEDNQELLSNLESWYQYPEIDLNYATYWSPASSAWNGITTPDPEDYTYFLLFDYLRGVGNVHIEPYVPYWDEDPAYHRLCNIVFFGAAQPQNDGVFIEDGSFGFVNARINPKLLYFGTFYCIGYSGVINQLPRQSDSYVGVQRFVRNDGTWAEISAKPKSVTKTIPLTAWNFSSPYYFADIEDMLFTATSVVDITPNLASCETVLNAGFLPHVDVNTGIITVYAAYFPEDEITVTINIF